MCYDQEKYANYVNTSVYSEAVYSSDQLEISNCIESCSIDLKKNNYKSKPNLNEIFIASKQNIEKVI